MKIQTKSMKIHHYYLNYSYILSFFFLLLFFGCEREEQDVLLSTAEGNEVIALYIDTDDGKDDLKFETKEDKSGCHCLMKVLSTSGLEDFSLEQQSEILWGLTDITMQNGQGYNLSGKGLNLWLLGYINGVFTWSPLP